MRTLKQSILYLLLLCFLSLITSQDTNAESYAYNYLTYLDKVHFQGSWSSRSSAKFAKFEEDSGFFTSRVNKDCELPVSKLASKLTFYDGKYIDGDSLEASFCQAFSPFFHFDPANASMIGTNVALDVSSKGISRVCSSDVSIHFIERKSNTPMTNLTNRDKREKDMGVQLVISSLECSFSVTTDVMTSSGNSNWDQLLIYCLVYAALTIYSFVHFFVLIDKTTDVVDHDQISAISLSWRCTWAIFFCIYNTLLMFRGGTSWSCGVSVMISILDVVPSAILSLINFDKRDEKRKKIYFVILGPFLLIIWTVAAYYDCKWIYLSSILYLVPQIIKIDRSGEKSKINLAVVLMFLPSQLFAMGYLWTNPDNFARMEPSPFLFFIYFVLAAIQVIILILQRNHHSYSIMRNQVRPID